MEADVLESLCLRLKLDCNSRNLNEVWDLVISGHMMSSVMCFLCIYEKVVLIIRYIPFSSIPP